MLLTTTSNLKPVCCRRWKALSIWRKAVRGAKTSGSAEHLQKSLFGLNPVLQQAVLTVR
jgi:hypothetical protein